MNIRYPNITAGSEREQIAQIRSWLHQLVDQLNYATDEGNTGADASGQNMEQAYHELRAMILREIQNLQAAFETLATQTQTAAEHAADRIRFTLDEEGNLYYELDELEE